MNFSMGKLIEDNGLYFKSDSIILRVTDSNYEKLKQFLGKSVWLGIRPEDISDNESISKNTAQVEVKLEVVEPMGNEIFLYFSVDSSQFVARIPAREKPEPNSLKTLYIDLNKLHFFDTETEKSI